MFTHINNSLAPQTEALIPPPHLLHGRCPKKVVPHKGNFSAVDGLSSAPVGGRLKGGLSRIHPSQLAQDSVHPQYQANLGRKVRLRKEPPICFSHWLANAQAATYSISCRKTVIFATVCLSWGPWGLKMVGFQVFFWLPNKAHKPRGALTHKTTQMKMRCRNHYRIR